MPIKKATPWTDASLAAAVAALGDTAAAIAETFRKAGIKAGSSCFDCPAAIYLGRHDGVVKVGYSTVKAWNATKGEWAKIETPEALQTFTRMYDAGKFPELIGD